MQTPPELSEVFPCHEAKKGDGGANLTQKRLVQDCPRFGKGSQKKDWILEKHAAGFKLPVRCQVCKREPEVRHCSWKKRERSSRADKNSQPSPAGGGGSPRRLCELCAPAEHLPCRYTAPRKAGAPLTGTSAHPFLENLDTNSLPILLPTQKEPTSYLPLEGV